MDVGLAEKESVGAGVGVFTQGAEATPGTTGRVQEELAAP
jgi:hypothetical protein